MSMVYVYERFKIWGYNYKIQSNQTDFRLGNHLKLREQTAILYSCRPRQRRKKKMSWNSEKDHLYIESKMIQMNISTKEK